MDIETPSLIIINGTQGSGKSWLIKYMMYKLRKKFSYGLVFTNTFFDNKPFKYIPDLFVHPEYDEEKLIALMDLQAKLVEKGNIKEAFVIFDDCMDDPGQFKSLALKRLTTQCRHYHITVIFSTQYCNHLPARMRTNAMEIIIFSTDAKVALEALYNSYGQKFENYNDFKKYVMENTGNHKFIYYKKKSEEKDLNKLYPVMMAPAKIPNFKIEY